jgi:hypothetical protein
MPVLPSGQAGLSPARARALLRHLLSAAPVRRDALPGLAYQGSRGGVCRLWRGLTVAAQGHPGRVARGGRQEARVNVGRRGV